MDIELLFWLIVDKLELLHIVYPLLLTFASLYWFVNSKSIMSLLAISGGALALISRVVQLAVDTVYWHQNHGFKQPIEDQSGIIYWLFTHGVNTGLFLFSIAILIYFKRKYGTRTV